MQLDHKNLVEDLDFWMHNFNKMKSSSKVRNLLKSVNFADLEQVHEKSDDFKQ